MKKKILILSALFLVFVIALAPASLLASFINQQEQVSASGLEGNIWNGEIAQLNVQNYQFNNINYSINPLALLLANLSLQLDITSGDFEGVSDLVLTRDYNNSFTLENANLTVEASQLEDKLPLSGVSLNGLITTTDLNLEVKDRKPDNVSGIVSWKNAALSSSRNQWDLGNFVLDIDTDTSKKEITGQLRKVPNKLKLEGKFTLSENGTFEFIGSIATDLDETLYNSVALFNNGKPANGRLPIKFKQKLF